jgi:hypothetical protein
MARRPLIGAGSGSFKPERTKAIIEDELRNMDYPMDVMVVIYKKQPKP